MNRDDNPRYPTEEVREAAWLLLAEWMVMWDNATTPTFPTSKQTHIDDLRKYSPTTFDEFHIRHDHDQYVFHPSLGDEAGYWTLYVTTANDPYRNLEHPRITGMWQVFDCSPNPIMILQENANPAENAVMWLHTPESQGYHPEYVEDD